MDMGRCVWLGGSFLRNDKWEIKLLSQLFHNCIQPFTNNSNSKIIIVEFQKFMNGYGGTCVWVRGKFPKSWQVTDKIIEGFKNSQMDIRGNSQMDIWGCVWVDESFLSHDKWQRKLLSDFLQFTFYILQMTQTQEIITHRVLKIHKWIWGGCVWYGESFLGNGQVADKII